MKSTKPHFLIKLKQTLIIITGPTAVGKTKLSIDLAKEYDCPIISCDSRQFYKGLNIGTAKPTKEEIGHVPHYFIDFLDVSTEYTAGIFETEALKLMQELFQKHNVLIMVGGSTLYVDAITKGFDDLPKNPELRDELIEYCEKNGVEDLLEELKEIDPEYYEIVDKSNSVRIQRAIEVIRTSGQKYSELRKGTEKKRDFEILKIVLDDEREELYERINARVDQMIEDGLEEEARKFYPHKGLTALKTVGYQEFFEFFDGSIDREKAIELIKRNSRRYAKRQLTWFRRDSDYVWFKPNQTEEVKSWIKSKI